jgi:hypothetical protein
VVLPTELPPQYAEVIERVARSCPAHNTLAHGADLTVSIETALRPDPYDLFETAEAP